LVQPEDLKAAASPEAQTANPTNGTAPASAAAEAAAPIDPATLRITQAEAYLIIARYDRERYNALGKARQHEAHEAAEHLFPEYGASVPLESKRGEGWLFARSFHSGVHAKVRAELGNPVNAGRDQGAVVEEVVQADIAQAVRPDAPGTSVPDPGIGWVLVMSRDQYHALRRQFGASDALWVMYKIDVIPLYGDTTTQDIYDFMTPVSWSK
jgi:hypothetical protein